MKSFWFISLLLLCGWTVMSLLWTPEFNHDTWSNIKKTLRFLLIPFFMHSFETKKNQTIAIEGFVIGMLITTILSMIKLNFNFSWYHDSDPGHLFYNHINTGFLCVFAAFCCLYYFLEKHGLKYLYLAAFFLLSIEILLVNPGRASYILYALVIVSLIWMKSNRKVRWVYLIISILLGLVLMKASSVLQTRIHDFNADLQALQQGVKSTSIGYRLQFYHFSWILFQKHILIGNGPGSFYYYFQTLHPIPDWTGPANPHSQYWLILVEEGLIGLCLWLVFFYYLWKKMEIIGKTFILLIAFNCLSDALLSSCPGQLLMGIAALSLCKRRKKCFQ
jgi:O-antigen ligase